MIVCSEYHSLVEKENMCEEEEYWATDLNDIRDDEALTNIDLDIPQQSEGQYFWKAWKKHYRRFSLEPVRMVVGAVKFCPSTAEAQTNDLLPLLTAQAKDGKEITFFKVDNGPDWNLLSVVNSLYFCKLWRDSELDVMGVCSYAARCSAYNNIEILFFFPVMLV